MFLLLFKANIIFNIKTHLYNIVFLRFFIKLMTNNHGKLKFVIFIIFILLI